jgi:hypothetical protein
MGLAPCRSKIQMKGARNMKTKLLTIILAAAFLFVTVMPAITEARGGGGKTSGQSLQTQTKSMDQNRVRDRLRDGSCTKDTQVKSGALQKKGNTYGPGDGTGNAGISPKDGTGYGAPANR